MFKNKYRCINVHKDVKHFLVIENKTTENDHKFN